MKCRLAIIWFSLSSLSWGASHQPQVFLDKIAGTSMEGQMIVKHYCANCHAVHPFIPLGAPRIGVKEDWTERLNQGKQQLFQHTVEGLRAMPARGGCFECTDQQLLLAIEVLIQ
ncbi:MAG TPA: c-type cytochrome [Legionellaceae bacterium]|nr:c-type cytochrome [Legionellaceae bacterium]